MNLYRVLAWNPITGQTLNAGLYIADSADHAIRKAERNRPENDECVLEAVEMKP